MSFGNTNYIYVCVCVSFCARQRDLFTMNIQLYNHKITVSRIAKQLGGDDVAKKYLSKCIYVSDMGHNDYLNNYFLDTYNSSEIYTPDEYAQHLIKTYKTQLEVSLLRQ